MEPSNEGLGASVLRSGRTWLPPTAGAVLLVSVVAVGAALAVAPRAVAIGVLALAALWVVTSVERGLYTLITICFAVPVTIDIGLAGSMLAWQWLAIATICLVGRVARLMADAKHGWPPLWLLSLFLPLALSAGVHGLSLRELSVAWRPYIVLFLLVWHFTAEAERDPRLVRRLVVAAIWLGAAMAVLALLQRASGSWPLLDALATRGAYTSAAAPHRSAGLLGHPLIYGSFCLAMALCAMGLRPRWWPMLALGNSLGLILSGTRSAWLGFVVAVVTIIVSGRWRLSPRMGYSVLVGGAVLLTASATLPRSIGAMWSLAFTRLSGLSESTSAQARTLRASVAWDAITSSPTATIFGHGPGSLGRFFGTHRIGDQFSQTFDNSYLTLWFEDGLLAVAWLIVALLIGIILARSTVSRLLLIAFAVQTLFFDFFNWPTLSLIVALAAAASVAGLDDRTAVARSGSARSLYRERQAAHTDARPRAR